MGWDTKPSRATRRQRRIRGMDEPLPRTWGAQTADLDRAEQAELRRIRGTGTWAAQGRRVDRYRRRKDRAVRGTGLWSQQSARTDRARRRKAREERRMQNPLYRLWKRLR